MKWETTEAILESAKKFADIEDDLAVKSLDDSDYKWHKDMADLFRIMSKEIERLDEVSAAARQIIFKSK